LLLLEVKGKVVLQICHVLFNAKPFQVLKLFLALQN
jgi:hypothetical protein